MFSVIRHSETLVRQYFRFSNVCLPGQMVQEGLELLTNDADHATLHSVVGDINEENEGWGLRKLIVLLERVRC